MAKLLIVLWIIIHCDKKTFKGMRWDNRAEGVFWLYWRHQSSRSCRENTRESYEYYEYYRAWARHKNNMKRKQPRDLKAAFRNALEKKSELERLAHRDTKDRIYWRIKNIDSFQYDPTQPFDEIQKPEKGTANRGKKETCPHQKYSVQNNRELPVNFGALTSSSSEEFSSFHYNPPQSFEQKPIKSTSNRGRRGAFSSQNHSVQNNNGFPVNNGASASNASEELPYERKRGPKTMTKARGQPGRKTWSRRKKSTISETFTSPSQATCYQSARNEISIDYEGTDNRSLPSFEELHESWRNNIPNATSHNQQFHNSSFHTRRDEDVWTPQYFSTVDRCTPPQHSSDILGNQTEIMDFYAPTPPTSVTSYPFQPTPPQQNTDISFDNYNTEFKTLEKKSEEHSPPIKYSYPFLQGETPNAQIQLNNTRISPVPPRYSISSPASQSICSNLQDLQTTKLTNISRNYYPLDHRHFSSPSSLDHQQYSYPSLEKNASSNCFSYLDTPPRDAFLDENCLDVEALHHQHHNILHQNQTASHEMENCVSEMIDNLSNSEIENILESVNRLLQRNGCL